MHNRALNLFASSKSKRVSGVYHDVHGCQKGVLEKTWKITPSHGCLHTYFVKEDELHLHHWVKYAWEIKVKCLLIIFSWLLSDVIKGKTIIVIVA